MPLGKVSVKPTSAATGAGMVTLAKPEEGPRPQAVRAFAPVCKLVMISAWLFAKGVAGEAGVKPGSDLLLPKISTFLSGHSGNRMKR